MRPIIPSPAMSPRPEPARPSAALPPAAAKPAGDDGPPLRLEVFVYSERDTERMVFINSRKYVEGQQVEGKYLLEAITPQGAVLSRDGQRFLLRP
jgi:type II secretion system (T2SS) protein B